jgi:DNA-binding transcriptional MocR family regulator
MTTDRAHSAWAAAVRREVVTVRQLAADTGLSASTIGDYLRRWGRAGRVERIGEGRLVTFRVKPEAPALPPAREQSPERNMWTALRKGGAFAAADLALQASTEAVRIDTDQAQRFLRALLPAGYLRVVQTARPPHRPAVYRLIRDTGPLPPVECRITAVWDPNQARWSHLPGGPA